MKVTIEAIGTADLWHLTGTVKLRIYANQSFINSDGQFVPQGIVGSSATAYLEVDCTVVANVLTIPAIEIDSTPDALTNIYATYTAEFVASGRRIPFLTNFAVNTLEDGDDSTTWGEIVLLRDMLSPQSIPDSLTRQLIANIQLAVGSLNKASSTNFGVTKLSVDPDIPSEPVAVGVNDPDYLAALGGNTPDFMLSSFADFPTAIAAMPATGATLWVDVEGVADTLTVPAYVTLKFTRAGKITMNAAGILTINGPVDADAVRIFFNALRNADLPTIQGTPALASHGEVLFTSNRTQKEVWANWWGADPAAALGDNLMAATSAIQSAPIGGTVKFAPGDEAYSMGPAGFGGLFLRSNVTVDLNGATLLNPQIVVMTPFDARTFWTGGPLTYFEQVPTMTVATRGTRQVTVASTAGFTAGRRVVVTAGNLFGFQEHGPYEFNTVESVDDATHITLQMPLKYTYIGLPSKPDPFLGLLPAQYLHDCRVTNGTIRTTPSQGVSIFIGHNVERMEVDHLTFQDMGSTMWVAVYLSQLNFHDNTAQGTSTFAQGGTAMNFAGLIESRIADNDFMFAGELPTVNDSHFNHLVLEVGCRDNQISRNNFGPVRATSTACIEVSFDGFNNDISHNRFWGLPQDIIAGFSTIAIRLTAQGAGNLGFNQIIGNKITNITSAIHDQGLGSIIISNVIENDDSTIGALTLGITSEETNKSVIWPNSFTNVRRPYGGIAGAGKGLAILHGSALPDAEFVEPPGGGSLYLRANGLNGATAFFREPSAANAGSDFFDLGFGETWVARNRFLEARVNHLIADGIAPSVAVGAGAGTVGGAFFLGGAKDAAGVLVVQVETAPSVNEVVAVVTFAIPYGAAPKVVLTPGNAAAAVLTGGAQVFVDSNAITINNFTIRVGATGLVANTTYVWFYQVIQ